MFRAVRERVHCYAHVGYGRGTYGLALRWMDPMAHQLVGARLSFVCSGDGPVHLEMIATLNFAPELAVASKPAAEPAVATDEAPSEPSAEAVSEAPSEPSEPTAAAKALAEPAAKPKAEAEADASAAEAKAAEPAAKGKADDAAAQAATKG